MQNIQNHHQRQIFWFVFSLRSSYVYISWPNTDMCLRRKFWRKTSFQKNYPFLWTTNALTSSKIAQCILFTPYSYLLIETNRTSLMESLQYSHPSPLPSSMCQLTTTETSILKIATEALTRRKRVPHRKK